LAFNKERSVKTPIQDFELEGDDFSLIKIFLFFSKIKPFVKRPVSPKNSFLDH
jgi:hypothetical protein